MQLNNLKSDFYCIESSLPENLSVFLRDLNNRILFLNKKIVVLGHRIRNALSDIRNIELVLQQDHHIFSFHFFYEINKMIPAFVLRT